MKSFLEFGRPSDREYVGQAYYDGTLANMDEDHPRYAEVRNNAMSLTELVEQLTVVFKSDSLRELCDLDEDARVAAAHGRHHRRGACWEREAEEAARQAEEALEGQHVVPGAATAFWPYNPRLP